MFWDRAKLLGNSFILSRLALLDGIRAAFILGLIFFCTLPDFSWIRKFMNNDFPSSPSSSHIGADQCSAEHSRGAVCRPLWCFLLYGIFVFKIWPPGLESCQTSTLSSFTHGDCWGLPGISLSWLWPGKSYYVVS